ncbi:hypothetical protein TTRE_0000373301 [Trichuris trichiura]|uniref:Uncharacterized protein n=1 Tax=Trichuris trichiura TaxID=36087 RepID=A0A077Z5P2_TRITR|nr:hypothetical protein TTRE_0000373301 [Trichuris trichiura]
MKALSLLFLLLGATTVSSFDIRYVTPLFIIGKAEAQGFLGILGSLMGGGGSGGGLGSLLGGGGGLLGNRGGGGLLGGLLPNRQGINSNYDNYDDYNGMRTRGRGRGRGRWNRFNNQYENY